MAGEQKQTALARWGSRESSPLEKVVLFLGSLAVLGLLVWGWIYFATGEREDREEREQVLDSRYVEKIEIEVINTRGQPDIIRIDGRPREDCEETDDGNLECEDDPQPTLDPDEE